MGATSGDAIMLAWGRGRGGLQRGNPATLSRMSEGAEPVVSEPEWLIPAAIGTASPALEAPAGATYLRGSASRPRARSRSASACHRWACSCGRSATTGGPQPLDDRRVSHRCRPALEPPGRRGTRDVHVLLDGEGDTVERRQFTGGNHGAVGGDPASSSAWSAMTTTTALIAPLTASMRRR